jgi:hypothetical protein
VGTSKKTAPKIPVAYMKCDGISPRDVTMGLIFIINPQNTCTSP